MNPPVGVLPVDKPEGPTSHDAVAHARRALRVRQIGHTGTLDPFASGLLLLCIGSATRIAEYLTVLPKRYRATVRLGQATTTDDGTGEVVSTSDAWSSVGESEIREALAQQVGEIQQLPPVYSAKKVGGERMYAAARRGEELERTPVTVTVQRIDLIGYAPPDIEIEVDCSSGTYIRSIGRDLGAALGVGAHLVALRRTRVGRFDVGDALPLERLGDPAAVDRALITPAAAVGHLPAVHVDLEGARRLANGIALPSEEPLPPGPLALLSVDGALLAIGEARGDRIQPRKVFA